VAGGAALSPSGPGPRLGPETDAALRQGKGIVALETSVIGQGLAPPSNVECLERMDAAIRASGSIPAWVGVLDGTVRVGLTPDELSRFTDPATVTKVTRRDLAVAASSGAIGATTVSATLWASVRAGVHVMATGGIGGVHPASHGGLNDVSADLLELARTPGLLVCSGPKSIVDPVATAEKLEELGVTVVGFGVERLPFFLAREAAVELEHSVSSAAEAAALLEASRELSTGSAILLCNPVPADEAMNADEIAGVSAEAMALAEREGVRGKALTPFLLSTIAEKTHGRSVRANLALLESNARVAGEIAAAYASAT
jgi:pseudouridylate synthase